MVELPKLGNGYAVTACIVILSFCRLLQAQSQDSTADISRPEVPGPTAAESTSFAIGAPLQWDHLTDSWFGIRPKLEDHGIIFSGTLINDWAKNLKGGVNTEGYNYGQLLNANITADTQKMDLWNNGKIFASFQNMAGEFASRDVGDIQIVDSLDSDARTQLSELWLEQGFFDDNLLVKVGKINANGDFASVPAASQFINSSMGISPTVLGIPKYPDPAMGIQFWYTPTPHTYIAGGVFDGATQEGHTTGDQGPASLFGPPSDLFMIGETGLSLALGPNEFPGDLGIGVWHHTGTFPRFDGGSDEGTSGVYFIFDQTVWKRDPSNKDDPSALRIYFQYGWADPNVTAFNQHIGAGISWRGLIPKRNDDILGLGATCVILSDKPGAGFDDSTETAIELFYQAKALKWLTIQPDLQYVINPGGVSRNPDAIVFIVRVSIDI